MSDLAVFTLFAALPIDERRAIDAAIAAWRSEPSYSQRRAMFAAVLAYRDTRGGGEVRPAFDSAGLHRARSEAMRRGDASFERADAIVRAYLGLDPS